MNGFANALHRDDYVRFVERGLDDVPHGYLLLEPGGVLLAANATASQLLGLVRPLPSGLRISDVLSEVHDFRGRPIPPAERPSARVFATRQVVRETLIALHRSTDASVTWVEVTSSPLFDEDGGMWGALQTFVDATERLEAERNVHRLASIVEATDHGAVVTDLARRIEWVNPAFTRMTGYAADEVVGRNPGELLQVPETDPETIARMRTSLDQGEGFQEEVLNRDKAGRLRWIDLEVQPLLDHLGRHTHWMGLKRDITERRAVEAELRRMTQRANAQTRALEIALQRAEQLAREARAADQTKDEFLRNASHELRTPLSGMLMAAGLLHDTVEEEQTKALARIALESGERLLGLVDDVLRFSRLAAEGVEPEPRGISPAALLSGLERMYQDTAKERGVDFVVTSTPADLPRVRGDQGLMWQVLVVLLDNAFALVDRGFVGLDLEVRRVAAGWALCFRVRDSGRGIPEADRRRIFEPFVQVDGSTSRDHEGIGLGLAIAREIAERLDARLEVVEVEGAVTCFEFALTLPGEPSEGSAASAGVTLEEVIERLSSRAPRVLVAEDDEIRWPDLRRSLRMFGVQADVMDDETPIPESLLAEHYDLLLLVGNVGDEARERLLRAFGEASKPRLCVGSRADDGPLACTTWIGDGFDLVELGTAMMDSLEGPDA